MKKRKKTNETLIFANIQKEIIVIMNNKIEIAINNINKS